MARRDATFDRQYSDYTTSGEISPSNNVPYQTYRTLARGSAPYPTRDDIRRATRSEIVSAEPVRVDRVGYNRRAEALLNRRGPRTDSYYTSTNPLVPTVAPDSGIDGLPGVGVRSFINRPRYDVLNDTIIPGNHPVYCESPVSKYKKLNDLTPCKTSIGELAGKGVMMNRLSGGERGEQELMIARKLEYFLFGYPIIAEFRHNDEIYLAQMINKNEKMFMNAYVDATPPQRLGMIATLMRMAITMHNVSIYNVNICEDTMYVDNMFLPHFFMIEDFVETNEPRTLADEVICKYLPPDIEEDVGYFYFESTCIWQLGVVGYLACVGRLPIITANPLTHTAAKQSLETALPDQTEITDVIMKCLHYNRHDRGTLDELGDLMKFSIPEHIGLDYKYFVREWTSVQGDAAVYINTT